MIRFRMTCTGTTPLLMHNARLANPLDPVAKEIKKVTGKRIKTDDDWWQVYRLEHLASLYLDPQVGPYIPGQNITRMLLDSARTDKQGPKIQRGLFIDSDVNELVYKGPRDADGLWADENFRLISSVKVQRNRTMRCRPLFRQWSCTATGMLDPSILELPDLESIAETASLLIGLGEWRPRYGRFACSIEKL